MVLPALLAGSLALQGIGTAANIYGTHQRDQATQRALAAWRQALDQYTRQEKQALRDEMGVTAGLAQDRQLSVEDYLHGMTTARGEDDGFTSRLAEARQDAASRTQGNDGSYSYSGAPSVQANQMQGARLSGLNERLANDMLSSYQDRQLAEKQRVSAARMSMADILRNAKTTDISQRFQLAKALRDLDWQQKQAAMQGQLDDAQRQGQWLNVLGGLGTQLGGIGASAGMMMGGGGTGGAGVAGGAPQPGPMAQSGFANMAYDYDLMNPMG